MDSRLSLTFQMKYIYLVALVLPFLSACDSNKPKSPFDFPTNGKPEFDLTGEKVYLPELITPSEINAKGKFLIVVEQWRLPKDKPLIHVIDKNSLEYIMPKGVNGLGPNEITDGHLFDSGFSDSTFWVHSAISKRMAEFSLYDTTLLSIYEFRQSEDMSLAHRVLFSTDSTFLCIVASDSNRFVEYDMEGKRIAGYGTWEPIPDRPGLTDNMIADINGGWFKVDRKTNLFVKASLFRDRIEIFDYNTKESIYVDGPRLDYPAFEVMGSGASAGVIISEEVKFGHRDIAFGEKYIYDLYGGFHNYADFVNTSKLAETIYILTKKGEVVAKLNLNHSLLSLTVDEALGKIYGITTDENPGIAVFDIPKELLDSN